jgi:hypothetical protein
MANLDSATKRKSALGLDLPGVETLVHNDATKAASWRAGVNDLYAGITFSDIGTWMMNPSDVVWFMADNRPNLAFSIVEGGAIDPHYNLKARVVGWLSNRIKLGFKKGGS